MRQADRASSRVGTRVVAARRLEEAGRPRAARCPMNLWSTKGVYMSWPEMGCLPWSEAVTRQRERRGGWRWGRKGLGSVAVSMGTPDRVHSDGPRHELRQQKLLSVSAWDWELYLVSDLRWSTRWERRSDSTRRREKAAAHCNMTRPVSQTVGGMYESTYR